MQYYEVTGPIGPVKLEVVKALVYKLQKQGLTVSVNEPWAWRNQFPNTSPKHHYPVDVIVHAATGFSEKLAIWHTPNQLSQEHKRIPLHTIMPRHLLRELYEAHGDTSGLDKPVKRGRPLSGEQKPKPVSWRPPSTAVFEAYKTLGGAKWLNATLQQHIDATKAEK